MLLEHIRSSNEFAQAAGAVKINLIFNAGPSTQSWPTLQLYQHALCPAAGAPTQRLHSPTGKTTCSTASKQHGTASRPKRMSFIADSSHI